MSVPTSDGRGKRGPTYHGDWVPYNETALSIQGMKAPLYHITAHCHNKKNTRSTDESTTCKRNKSQKKYVENQQWERMIIPTALPGLWFKCSVCGKEFDGNKMKTLRDHYRKCIATLENAATCSKRRGDMEGYQSYQRQTMRMRR